MGFVRNRISHSGLSGETVAQRWMRTGATDLNKEHSRSAIAQAGRGLFSDAEGLDRCCVVVPDLKS